MCLPLARLRSRGLGEGKLTQRIAALALQLFGDLNGVWHSDEET